MRIRTATAQRLRNAWTKYREGRKKQGNEIGCAMRSAESLGSIQFLSEPPTKREGDHLAALH
jgi:hypothetical protein